MKILLAFTLCFFSATSFADMTTITEVYEASSARLDNVGTLQPVVKVKTCDKCAEMKINLADDVKIIYQKKELSQHEYLMNYPRFSGFLVSHHLPSNSVTLIQAY